MRPRNAERRSVGDALRRHIAAPELHRPAVWTHGSREHAQERRLAGAVGPHDADGNAIRGALGPLLKGAGYTIVDPGAYEDGTNDYSAQIQRFIQEDCQIFNTFPIPPDFATFWRQAAQQGYTKHVKIGQIAKTGLFPS